TMRIFPVWRRVAEMGLMGIRYGSVTHVPVTCGTLAAQVCARAGPGRPKVPAASIRRANRALRSIWVLFPRADIQPERCRKGRCAPSLAKYFGSPGHGRSAPVESNGHATDEGSSNAYGDFSASLRKRSSA